MIMLLYARKRGPVERRVIELESKKAIKIMKQNRKCDFQLGMIGSSLISVISILSKDYKLRAVSYGWISLSNELW